MPVAIPHDGSVRTVTLAGQLNPRPTGYRKRLVPLKKAKLGAVHATARSTALARYLKLTRTVPAARGVISHVWKSSLRQSSGTPFCCTENPETRRENQSST